MQLISPKHISAYFQCRRKAYLLVNSVEHYEQVDYEILINKAKEKAIETYYEKSGKVQLYEEGILREGLPAIYNTRIDIQGFNFDSQLLLRKKGKSSLGKFYYEPAIFIGTNKISIEHRMELSFLGFLLEKLQNTFPKKGVIVDKGGNLHYVDLTKLRKAVEAAITEILDFDKNPPRLILNRHCNQCPFNN
jgi:predicted RecB family nuclease